MILNFVAERSLGLPARTEPASDAALHPQRRP